MKLFDMLDDAEDGVKKILNRSTRAVCGAFERQVVVKDEDVAKTKKKLKNAGFIIVGSGDAGFGKDNVWFSPAGANL